MTRNKVAVTNNCSAMTVVFIPQVAEAIHQTINRKQQHPTSIGPCAAGAHRFVMMLEAGLRPENYQAELRRLATLYV